MDKLSQNHSELKSKILTRIEKESLSPRSWWYYGGRECLVWAAWLLTVVVAAVAVAITLFVFGYRGQSFYQATHESFRVFVFGVLPYLWLSIFAAMALLAVYNLRHTKSGYRYPLWKVLSSGIILSLGGGILLHLAGAGFNIDRQLGMLFAHYQSQDKIELQLWQQPTEGRLVGVVLNPSNEALLPIIIFEDVTGVLWETNISELEAIDTWNLKTGTRVRVLGQMLTATPPQFHACAIFPWIYERAYTNHELSDLREEMYRQIFRHQKELLEGKTRTRMTDGDCTKLSVLTNF